MKRNFSGYSIDAKLLSKKTKNLGDGVKLVEAEVLLSGNIEIPLSITRGTWKEDWLTRFVFSRNVQLGVRSNLLSIENQYLSPTETKVFAKYTI